MNFEIDPEKLQAMLVEWGINIIAALVIFIIGKWVAGMIRKTFEGVLTKRNVDKTIVSFLGNLGYMLLLTLVTLMAVGKLGVNTTSFVAVIGAAGLAIGLALQGSLSNFANGVMLIIFRPFKAGDFIEAGGAAGVVEEIQVFCTKMRTGDNKQIIIPNSAVMGGKIVNFSTKETRRVDLVFGIGYDDDLRKAKDILKAVLAGDERILKDPESLVAVSELGESSVNFVVRAWVKTDDYWDVHFHLLETVKLRFDDEGITIPFPQQDVHMHQVAAA
ncbi:MAG: small conductance mechanosensitive channel [Candidatus Binatia bacterium]|jgi:small conductance mechanosensitive channel